MSTEQEVIVELAASVKELANARAATYRLKNRIDMAEAALAATQAGKDLEALRMAAKLASVVETRLAEQAKAAAESAYIATGDKKPHPAITLKSYTVLDYDETAAFDYAIQHLPGALKFSKAPFEKVAKVAALDFVTISTEMRPTIAKDLSEYED